MPFMSSRKDGRPVALMDVLWAGKEPAPAYAFEFNSRGRRWRCVTPKPCSNFYVEDLGPLPRAAARLVQRAVHPTVCAPFEYEVTMFNTGQVPLTNVRVVHALPPELATEDGQQEVTLDADRLPVGEGQRFRYRLRAAAAGEFASRARATSAEGASAEDTTVLQVHAPRLVLDCGVAEEGLAGRPLEVCLAVANRGDAPEPGVTLTLRLPPGVEVGAADEAGQVQEAQITWEAVDLPPGAMLKRCATVRQQTPGVLTFTATARGLCAPTVETACSTVVAGVPGILLEVVDLADPIEVGETVTYEILVLNQGSATLTNLRWVGRLAETQSFISAEGETTVDLQPGSSRTLITTPLARLEPRAKALWRVTARADAAGESSFVIELTADQYPAAILEVESTTQY